MLFLRITILLNLKYRIKKYSVQPPGDNPYKEHEFDLLNTMLTKTCPNSFAILGHMKFLLGTQISLEKRNRIESFHEIFTGCSVATGFENLIVLGNKHQQFAAVELDESRGS